MFEFNGIFINPFEVASAYLETSLGSTVLILTLSSGDSYREFFNDRDDAISLINEISEIINPADFFEEDEEDEEWL